MFGRMSKNTEGVAPLTWGPASSPRHPLGQTADIHPRPRRIDRVIEAVRVNDRSKHRMTWPATSRPATAATTSDDAHRELQVRALCDQFKAVEPESLCVHGGMTRAEYIKFLTILSEAILRDTVADKAG
jgi:hypothetical protein